MFLSVGQKFLKKDQETNTITEVYRVISNKDRNYYRVMPVIPEGKSRLIRREVVDNEYFVPETHAKLFIAIYETDKGNDAIIVSLSNLDDDLPFYIARHEGNTFKHSSYGDTPNEGYLEKYYDIVYGLGDIKSRLDIDLYLNDSEDMILSLVSLDFDITNKMVELIESTGLKLDTKITKDPLPWIQLKYTSQKSVANAPQETKVTAYLKDPINKLDDLTKLKQLFG